MSSALILILMGVVWTIASTVQAIGRWKGNPAWLEGDRTITPHDARADITFKINRSLVAIPFIPTSITLISIARLILVHDLSGFLRYLAFVLIGVGSMALALGATLIVTLFSSGRPTKFVPPQYR